MGPAFGYSTTVVALRRSMLDVADMRQALTFEDFYDWTPTLFRDTHPLPEVRDVYQGSNNPFLGDHIGNYGINELVTIKLHKSREIGKELALMVPTGKSDPEPTWTAYLFAQKDEQYMLETYLPRLLGGPMHCFSRW